MPRGRPKKDKDIWENLDDVFRDKVDHGTEAEIRQLLSVVALDQQSCIEEMAADQDLQEKKMSAKIAGECYVERRKANSLKIKYAKQLLTSQGKIKEV